MRLRKRHAWGAVLIVLFVLPVAKPDGFPGMEGWFDGVFNWTARSDVGNPHVWAVKASDGDDDGPRAKALEQIAIAQREDHFALLDELAQKSDLRDALKGFDRLPLALPSRVLRANDPSGTRRSCLIDRGSDDGVEIGQAVVQGPVFLGTVFHVEPHSARVQLLTDPYSRLQVAVRTQEGLRATAWLRGGSDDGLGLRLLRGTEGLHVRSGDPVLTSNADERVPAGLIVGRVLTSSDADADSILEATVRPQLNLDHSATVLVLIPSR